MPELRTVMPTASTVDLYRPGNWLLFTRKKQPPEVCQIAFRAFREVGKPSVIGIVNQCGVYLEIYPEAKEGQASNFTVTLLSEEEARKRLGFIAAKIIAFQADCIGDMSSSSDSSPVCAIL